MAMRIYMLFLVVLYLLTAKGFSQSTFSRVIDSAQVYSAVVDVKDNFYFAGRTMNDFLSSTGALIGQIDANTNVAWSKVFGMNMYDYANSIVCQGDTLFVAGSTYLQKQQRGAFLCIKMKTNGDTLWTRVIDFGGHGIAATGCYCVDNGFAMIGWVSAINDKKVLGVSKLSSNGKLQWSRAFQLGSGIDPVSIKESLDGSFLIAANVVNLHHGILFKLSSLGNLIWTKYFLDKDNKKLRLGDVIPLNSNLLLVLGGGQTIFAKIDAACHPIWAKESTDDIGLSIYHNDFTAYPLAQKTQNSGFICPQLQAHQPFSEFSLMDSVGNNLWLTRTEFYGRGVVCTSDGGYIAYGNGPVDGLKQSTSNYPQIGLTKINVEGKSDSCTYTSSTNNVITMITSKDTSALDFVLGKILPHQLKCKSITLSKRADCVYFTGSISEPYQLGFQLIASPNPTSGQFELSFSDNQNHKVSSLEVVNALGEVVYHMTNIKSVPLSINLENKGLYIVRAQCSDSYLSSKVVIY
jgi:hypothetical protein